MKTATLTFLRRLLAMALGALGLGALAAGTASAQQIPAPDIFNDQIACSMNVPSAMDTPMPSVIPMGATMSPLDTLIGMGTVVIDVNGTGASSYEALGYVIDATVANCGGASTLTGGTPTSATAFTITDDGSVPFDVAAGYTELLTKFRELYGDPGDAASTGLKGAFDTAAMALAMGIADGEMGTTLTLLQNANDRAEKAYMDAKKAFDAASMGPIYMAGVEEWKAKAAVTEAVGKYNAQVGTTNTALETLNTTNYVEAPAADGTAGASKWVPLGNTELFAGGSPVVTVADGMGTVNLDQLIQYANGDLATPQVGTPGMVGMGTGDGTPGNDEAVASVTTDSNFDAHGNLIIPMSVDPNDAAALVRTTSATNTVADIRTLVDNSRIAAEALEAARDAHGDGINKLIYVEAAKRARAEADYYAARWAEVLVDNTDQRTAAQKLQFVDDNDNKVNDPGETTPNTDYMKDPISIAARNSAYTTESNKRMELETTLRANVALREMATENVRTQFTDAQAFYAQLVARRTALANVPNAPESATTALAEAQAAQTRINALFDDPSDPSEALIEELLKGDTDGDDGGALVEAISTNHDNIMSLTAEDDPNTPEDESGAVTTNANNIMGLTEKVNMLTGENGQGGNVQSNTERLDALLTTADDGTESGRVKSLEDDVDELQLDIYGEVSSQHDDGTVNCTSTALRDVANCANARAQHNADDILGLMGEDGAIAMGDNAVRSEFAAADDVVRGEFAAADDVVRGEFAAADAGLAGEGRTTETIKGNADAIATNAGNIMENAGNIVKNVERLDMHEGLVMTNIANIETNAGSIMNNAGNIAMNAEMIGANAGAIMMNAGAISTNATAIAANRQMIDRNVQDIDMLRSGVAASMALAGLPEIGDRGVSVGAGSFDGESAIAVGVHFSGENSRFRLGVSSSGGETGASVGAGWSF